MTRTVTAAEAQNQFQHLLALTRNGDEIIIEENGQPLARIVPFTNADLPQELAAWNQASDEDFLSFEKSLSEKS